MFTNIQDYKMINLLTISFPSCREVAAFDTCITNHYSA